MAYFASRVVDKIGNDCTIIYTDFINSVGPIMSELSAFDVDLVAYYGEMDVKSRNESYHRWKSGEINVMVATSAFGMGIDKSNIKQVRSSRKYVQLGTRIGQGWKRRRQCYCNHFFYSTSDIDHAGTWIRDHVHNFDYCNRILKEFGNAWKYVMSHLSGEYIYILMPEESVFETIWRR